VLSVCLCISYILLNVWTNLYETWYVYHGTWAHLNGVFHKFLPSVCQYVYPFIVARQWAGKNVAAAMNTHKTTELLDASISMRSVPYQRKVGDYIFPELLVLFVIILDHKRERYSSHPLNFGVINSSCNNGHELIYRNKLTLIIPRLNWR
jgi:hypothetical protein